MPIELKETERKTYPEVKFAINQELDVWKINEFITRTDQPGGMDPRKMIIDRHPALAAFIDKPDQDREQAVRSYVEAIYKGKTDKYQEFAQLMTKSWADYSEKFFQACEKLFPSTPWPEGDYRGFLTISSPCPRFIDSKTFQVPIGVEKFGLRVTAHEMLHFLFFEYVRRRYLPESKNLNEPEIRRRTEGKFIAPIWGISEAFNMMVLTQDNFGIAGSDSQSVYNKLQPLKDKMKTIWDESRGNIDEFFTRLEVRES